MCAHDSVVVNAKMKVIHSWSSMRVSYYASLDSQPKIHSVLMRRPFTHRYACSIAQSLVLFSHPLILCTAVQSGWELALHWVYYGAKPNPTH
jgi:hypothetical protein